MTAKRVTCGSASDRTVKLNCLGSRVTNDAGLLVRLVPRGEEIPSLPSCGDKISSCLLWRQDFHLVEFSKLKTCCHKRASCRRHVQVENLHPQVKNLHPQKTRACLLFSYFGSPSSWRQDLHRVEFSKLKTCCHKRASCRRQVQVKNLHPQVENLHPQKS